MKCRQELPKTARPARAAGSYTGWQAACGCTIEVDAGETVYAIPGKPGAYVAQGERGGNYYHYCPDIEVN